MTAIQCYSTNIQIFKSFKLYCIQGSIAAWLKLSFKHSNHSSFLNSSQLFSMASAFLQTFRYSNHSKFISFKTALQRSFSFQHSHRNFFRNCFSSFSYYSSAAFFRAAYLQHTSTDSNHSNFILFSFIRTLSETFKISITFILFREFNVKIPIPIHSHSRKKFKTLLLPQTSTDSKNSNMSTFS